MLMIEKKGIVEQIDSIAHNDKVDKFKAAKFVVENAPTIKAEPVRHGRWAFGAKADYIGSLIPTGISFFCSCCGKEAIYYAENTQALSDYCPNCGAKMDGGAENGKA